METTRQLADAIFLDKVRAARQMSCDEKMVAGIRLYVQVKRRMCEGIRSQFPDADEAEVLRILDERLEIAERIENTPWTK